MKIYSKIFYLFTLLPLISGCSDKLSLSALDGTYTGEFHYISPTDTVKRTGPASITFNQQNFTSARNADRIPAGGSGTLELLDDNLIDFKDENVWTANFDWGLILNGKFKYEFKGDSLILNRYFEPCPACIRAPSTYQYKLKRTN